MVFQHAWKASHSTSQVISWGPAQCVVWDPGPFWESPADRRASAEEKESKLVTIKQIRQERQLLREPGSCDHNLGVGGCCYGFVPPWIGFVIFVFLKMIHTMCVFVMPTKQMITRRQRWHLLGSGKMWEPFFVALATCCYASKMFHLSFVGNADHPLFCPKN